MSQYETLGPYQLIKRIAVGGTAEIFLARRSGQLGGFEKYYALKVILPHHQDDEDWRKMLFDEARLCAQLQHDNIVGVLDLAEEDGRLYMVMEYVRGQDLSMIVDALKACNGLMAIEVAAYLTREVCAGLHYAHTRKDNNGQPLGLVHRDISPQNILTGIDGDVKIIDFGVAKLRGRGRLETQTGIIKGKLRYMAPEYAVGNQQDARSDIFALGLCFYELIAGQPAYDDETLERETLVEKIRTADIDPPSSVRQDIPPELEEIVIRSLAAHPAERYQSALQMQRALSLYLAKAAPDFTKAHLSTYFERLFEKLDILPEVASNIDPEGVDAETVRTGEFGEVDRDVLEDGSKTERVEVPRDESGDEHSEPATDMLEATELEIDVQETRTSSPADDTASLLTPTGFSRSLRKSDDETPRARIETNWSPTIDRSVPEPSAPATPSAKPITVTLADRIPTGESAPLDEPYEPDPTEKVPIPEPARQRSELHTDATEPVSHNHAMPPSDVPTEAMARPHDAVLPGAPAPISPSSSQENHRPTVPKPDPANVSGQFQARPRPPLATGETKPKMGETTPGRQGLRIVDEWRRKYDAWIATEEGQHQAHLIRIAAVSFVFVSLFVWALSMLT